MWTDIDKEMKRFEAAYEQRVPKANPFLIRLDGARFSKYTKQPYFKEDRTTPFSIPFTEVMKGTAEALLVEFNPASVYTSSDEITMVFKAIDEDMLESSQHIYSGRIQKLASLTASFAAAKFNHLLLQLYPERQLAFFDARVFSVPDKAMAAKNIKWRANADAARNSYSKLVQFHLGAKQHHNMTKKEVKDALREKGVIWDELPPHIKHGSVWKKKRILRQCFDQANGDIVQAMRTGTTLTPLHRDILQDDAALQSLLFDESA